MVSVTDPYSRILGFLEGAATFRSSSSSVVLTRLSGPRSRPITFFSGSPGNQTRASGSVELATRPQRRSAIMQIFCKFLQKMTLPT
jgi:hypothetical protein